MITVSRTLDRGIVASLEQYGAIGGGAALDLTMEVGGAAIIDVLSEAGLRGRGGAGFPTALKWQTVAASRSEDLDTTVVVNAAEGEPGTFKDRALLRTNPYRVLEGAVIAAHAVEATRIRIGIKATFGREIERLRQAIGETTDAGWFEGIDIDLVFGPNAYLFGEETALLEVVEGRQPFPRVAPPFRRGIEEGDTRSAGGVDLATLGGSDQPPALVDNVETLANVPLIVTNGPDWFRDLGTERSPGTIICTVTGATRRHGVAEVPMGTTLREVIDVIGWGVGPGRRIGTVLSGVANALIPEHLLDTPLTYEAMRDAGTGLGSAGFIVFSDDTDPVSVARGVSRFLGVESCGQCEHCKRDGLEIADLLDTAQHSAVTEAQLVELRRRVQTVSIGARCNLARQQEDVVGSLLNLFGDVVEGHRVVGSSARTGPSPDSIPIVPIEDMIGSRATLNTGQLLKQPDWSYDTIDSGTSPAERLGNTPVHIEEPVHARRWSDWTAGSSDDDSHPLEIIDGAHNLLDGLLVDALDAGSDDVRARMAELIHITRVHVDATRRILYPMARRYAGEAGEIAADGTEEQEDLILALVNLLENVELSEGERIASLRALGAEFQRHNQNEEEILELLHTSMDPDEQQVLAEGLLDARMTSRV